MMVSYWELLSIFVVTTILEKVLLKNLKLCD